MIPSMQTNPGQPPNPALFTTLTQAGQIQAAMIALYGGVFCPLIDMAPGLTNGQGAQQWGVITPASPFAMDCGFLLSHVTPNGSWQKAPNGGQPEWVGVVPPPDPTATPVPGTTSVIIPGITSGGPAAENPVLVAIADLKATIVEGFKSIAPKA